MGVGIYPQAVVRGGDLPLRCGTGVGMYPQGLV